MTTSSFSTVLFNWTTSGDMQCNSTDVLRLQCSSLDWQQVLRIGEFVPLEDCFIQLFGFAASSVYDCNLTSADAFVGRTLVETLSEGNNNNI